MLGLSYGEIFLLIGATAALIGPKDLPIVARAAGRLAGRGIGYVQMARGQFDNIMQQSQATQVHKELQDTLAQLEAIRYEIRSISLINPGPLTWRLNDEEATTTNGSSVRKNVEVDQKSIVKNSKEKSSMDMNSASLHSQATTYARLAESPSVRSGSLKNGGDVEKLNANAGLLAVLPVSAETAGLLPKTIDGVKGSDIVLEAIVESEVACNAKDFFSQPQNQINSQ